MLRRARSLKNVRPRVGWGGGAGCGSRCWTGSLLASFQAWVGCWARRGAAPQSAAVQTRQTGGEKEPRWRRLEGGIHLAGGPCWGWRDTKEDEGKEDEGKEDEGGQKGAGGPYSWGCILGQRAASGLCACGQRGALWKGGRVRGLKASRVLNSTLARRDPALHSSTPQGNSVAINNSGVIQ